MPVQHRRSLLFLCPSLVGAGVERRVCTLVKQFKDSQYAVKLGLLRLEGEFLNEASDLELLHIPLNRPLRIIFAPLIRFYNLYNFVHALYQIKAMLAERPAIVVTFTLETTLPMYVVRRFMGARGIRWVISEDSNTAKAIMDSCRYTGLIRWVSSVVGKAYCSADFVTTVSSSVQRSVRQHYGVPKHKINTIHNPVDIATVKSMSTIDLNKQYDVDFILAVGRLVKVKQFDLLIRAFSEVRRSHRIKLFILGSGPEKKNLQRTIQELGLSSEVCLIGFVDNPWAFMTRAKLLVVTSKIEGFGNVIVEAMAIGCPVLATRCGGPEDIIKQGQNGVLVESNCSAIATQINRLLDDSARRKRLAATAHLECEQYEPRLISDYFLAMLDRLYKVGPVI